MTNRIKSGRLDVASSKCKDKMDEINKKDVKPSKKSLIYNRNTIPWLTHVLRGLILGAIALIIWNVTLVQHFVDIFYKWLLSSWAFNSVYFETWHTTVCYAILMCLPYTYHQVKSFEKYKIEQEVVWKYVGLKTIMIEMVSYCSPFMLLDTFMVKKYTYTGIDSREWTERSKSWIQTTRALPELAPTVGQLAFQLVASFLIYDLIFYFLHLSLHKNIWLYKIVHKEHHDHDTVNSRVTNQLSLSERIMLVLSANFALRIVHGHPLTRLFFVPVFISWLIDNHCGYDLPWSIDKLVPFGLVGGPVTHYAHHVYGDRHYQPFFTYIDNIVNFKSTKKKKQ